MTKNPELLKYIAHKTKTLREARSLTHENFYNDTGINPARIESGQNDLSISTLSRICEYLNTSISDFLKDFR